MRRSHTVATLVLKTKELRFAWDERKAGDNRSNHGVSFEEAKTVFLDENALLIPDDDHSENEDRFVLMGLSSALRLSLVCHCYRADDDIIRIISARKANRSERRQYQQRRT